MKKLWLTYAWSGNKNHDVDYIIQELDRVEALDVHFDRKDLIPGQRLWTQIAGNITDPELCDAWGMVLSPETLQSQACLEELSYALDRALASNGTDFPVFALFYRVEARDLPAALRIRLSVRLENNPNWIAEVEAACYGRPAGLKVGHLQEFVLAEYDVGGGYTRLEIRPRFDRIARFRVGVDRHEYDSKNVVNAVHGPPNNQPSPGRVTFNDVQGTRRLADGIEVYMWGSDAEASPDQSYYLIYRKRPNRVWIGDDEKVRVLPGVHQLAGV